jgi:hypothetical protein
VADDNAHICQANIPVVAGDTVDCSYSGGNVTGSTEAPAVAFSNKVVVNQVQSGAAVLTQLGCKCEDPLHSIGTSIPVSCTVVPGAKIQVVADMGITGGDLEGVSVKWRVNNNSGVFSDVNNSSGVMSYLANSDTPNLTDISRTVTGCTQATQKGVMYTQEGDFPQLAGSSGECFTFGLHGRVARGAQVGDVIELQLETTVASVVHNESTKCVLTVGGGVGVGF